MTNMVHLVNIKGYRKAVLINGEVAYRWWLFFVTRSPYAAGVTGMEVARVTVYEDTFAKYGPPELNTVYEVEYGPHDTLDWHKKRA